MTTTYKLKKEEVQSSDEYKTIEINIPQEKPADRIEETTPARLKEEIVRLEEERDSYITNINTRIDEKKAMLSGIKTSLKLDITIE